MFGCISGGGGGDWFKVCGKRYLNNVQYHTAKKVWDVESEGIVGATDFRILQLLKQILKRIRCAWCKTDVCLFLGEVCIILFT